MTLSKAVNPTFGYIRILVPQQYYRQPIFSQLISHYGLTINITAAFFDAHAQENGWFDLEIHGTEQQIEASLAYLKGLSIEIVQRQLSNISPINKKHFQLLCLNSIKTEDDVDLTKEQTGRAKLQVCIPKNYHSSPVIAGLVSCYGLTVNITAALLDTNTKTDGWFDLELSGSRQQIAWGWKYLKQLGLQVWL